MFFAFASYLPMPRTNDSRKRHICHWFWRSKTYTHKAPTKFGAPGGGFKVCDFKVMGLRTPYGRLHCVLQADPVWGRLPAGVLRPDRPAEASNFYLSLFLFSYPLLSFLSSSPPFSFSPLLLFLPFSLYLSFPFPYLLTSLSCYLGTSVAHECRSD